MGNITYALIRSAVFNKTLFNDLNMGRRSMVSFPSSPAEVSMSILGRFRVLTKVLFVTGLLSAVAAAIGAMGINALKNNNETTKTIQRKSAEAVLGARMGQNVLAMSLSEYRVAVDPGSESNRAAREVADEESRQLGERIAELKKQVTSDVVKERLAQVEKDWSAYGRTLESSYRAAEGVKDFKMTDEMARLRDTVVTSRKSAEALRLSVRAMVDQLDKENAKLTLETEEENEHMSTTMLIIASAGITLGLVLGILIGQYGIAKPARALATVLQHMATGDFTVLTVGADRKDEIGEIAIAVEGIKAQAAERARSEAEEKQRADAAAAAQRRADMHALADRFEAAVGEIVGTVAAASSELEAAATTLTGAAESTQQLSTVVASASEEASSNVQSVASATEELSSSVSEIGRQVHESSRIASEAVQQAQQTDVRINELSQAAGRIGDVVKLITAVAEQTNLLALNATIEAARAGEAGRGFAVVAQEVKSLAAQTAKATDEISTQISGMQAATQASVTAIKEIGSTIGRISEISTTIASAVEEQGAATLEISRNVQQAAAGSTQVASNIVDVNKGAGETGSAASQVLWSARALSMEGNKLKVEVNKFLATVRAA